MSNKKIVIVDIDGTIAKVGDRLKYLQQDKPDWDAFYDSCFEDEPITEVIDLVKLLVPNYRVVFCTGRRESVRKITSNWIKKHVFPDFFTSSLLLMRPNGDHRHDTEVKPQLLKENGIRLYDIAFVLEDRNSMVKKWRELGLNCWQVAEGDF